MRRNKHLGLTQFKWRCIGIILAYLYNFLFDLIAPIILNYFLPNKENDVSKLFINLNAEWKNNTSSIFNIFMFAFFLEAIFGLARTKKGITESKLKLLEIIPRPLYVYAIAFLGYYKSFFIHVDTSHEEIWWYALCLIIFKVTIPVFIQKSVSDFYLLKLKLNDHPIFRRIFILGYGGSARWANLLEFEKIETKPSNSQILGITSDYPFFGKSLFDDDTNPRLISSKDDAHLITIGMTGAGKSTTVLYPNLALYNGSIFAFDPKGELALKTYKRRTSTWQLKDDSVDTINTRYHLPYSSYLLDPYGQTGNKLPYNCYNPLSEIDINSDNCMDLISAVADGCVVITGKETDTHWNEWAKNFIEALIVHVLSSYPKNNHNLPFILDLFTGQVSRENSDENNEGNLDSLQELLFDMMINDSVGGLAQKVATQINRMGQNEKGSILSSTYRSLKWVGDIPMRKHLIKSDFSICSKVVAKNIYFVLSANRISSQMRWVRVLTSVFIIQEQKQNAIYKPACPTLFILDEFYQLGGKIDAISKGFPILRGFNIKLWLFFQSISQIKDTFGEGWSDIISASTVQIFGVKDPETSEWVSTNLGVRNNKRRTKFKLFRRSRIENERIDSLMTPDEVTYELGKEKDLQIIFPTTGHPMRLQRLTYLNIPTGKFESFPLNLEGHFEDS